MREVEEKKTDQVKEIFEYATIDRSTPGYYPATYQGLVTAIINLRGADRRTVNSWLWRVGMHPKVQTMPQLNPIQYGKRPPEFRTAVYDDQQVLFPPKKVGNAVEESSVVLSEDETSLLDSQPVERAEEDVGA